MEQSNLVSSANRGYWPDSNPMTAKFEVEYDIIQNSIESLNNRVKEFAIQKNKYLGEDFLFFNELTTRDIEFNLPNSSRYFDIYNSKRFSKKIQNWQGVVLTIESDFFTAKMTDLSLGGTYEIGEFDLDDVSPDDLPLLSIGAIFYWSVGHYMENGQSVKRSDIRFQRLITLDFEDIDLVTESINRNYSNLKERKLDE